MTVTEHAGAASPPPAAPSSSSRARNVVLVLTIVLLAVAVGLAAFAWTVRADTDDLQATTARRVERTETIAAEAGAAERDLRERATAVDGAFRATLGAIQDQSDASVATVEAANEAADRYSSGEVSLPDAFGALGDAPVAELERLNRTVRSALASFRLALEELRGDG